MIYRKFYIITAIFPFILILGGCKKETSVTEPDKDHFDAEGLVIMNDAFQEKLRVFRGITTDTLKVPLNGMTEHLKIKFLDENNKLINPPEDKNKTLSWVIADTTKLGVFRHDDDSWEFHLMGKKEGKTTIEFQILHVDHPDFRTPALPVVIK